MFQNGSFPILKFINDIYRGDSSVGSSVVLTGLGYSSHASVSFLSVKENLQT